jgi:hypothetical protein
MATKLDSIRDPKLRDQIALGLKCCKEKAKGESAPPQLSEKELQHWAEAWLESKNYHRLTPKHLKAVHAGEPCRGWFAHWPHCEGNPTCADLLIFDYPITRTPLWVELKVANKFQPGQKEAISLRIWKVAFTMEQFTTIVEAWEGGVT